MANITVCMDTRALVCLRCSAIICEIELTLVDW